MPPQGAPTGLKQPRTSAPLFTIIKPFDKSDYADVEQDLYRLNTLKRLGILPFVQPFRDYTNNRKPTQYERDLGRWANRAWLFKSMDFMDYEPRKGFKCAEYFK